LLSLSRNGVGKHLTNKLEPSDQIVRPSASFAEGRESNRPDNVAADPKRNAQMGMESRPFEIFSLADRFWWKIIRWISYCEDLTSTEFCNKPGKLRWKRT
jgi:hypothetical protein